MNYKIKSIGNLANQILQSQPQLTFFGQTSKGIFLLSNQNKILFISAEKYQGPYTININLKTSSLPACTKQTTITAQKDQINFVSPTFQISATADLKIYLPTFTFEISPQKISQNTKVLINHIPNHSNQFLSTVLSLKNYPSTTQYSSNPNQQTLIQIRQALQNSTETQLNNAFSKLIGVGAGLTPSGDDFICGVILAESIIKKKTFTNHFKENLKKEALKKTTIISANLIEAAFQKTADQRIINLIKEICADEFTNISAIEQLSTWGNSSGLDTLAGILLSAQISQ